jgi:hypothetical protein
MSPFLDTDKKQPANVGCLLHWIWFKVHVGQHMNIAFYK